MRGDEGPDERSDTVPCLRELQTAGGRSRVTNDSCIRVGRDLQSGKTASDDKSACDEASEGSTTVVVSGEVSRRPEHDGSQAVEGQAHDDSLLVAIALHDLSGNRGVQLWTCTFH